MVGLPLTFINKLVVSERDKCRSLKAKTVKKAAYIPYVDNWFCRDEFKEQLGKKMGSDGKLKPFCKM